MSGAVLAGESSAADGRGRANGGAAMHGKDAADIKDYVETTMNELLGWYGYDKADDSRGLNLKRLHSSSSSSPVQDLSDPEDTAQSTSPSPQDAERPQRPSSPAAIVCGWCQRPGLRLFTLRTPGGTVREFCSEPCFSQCRRAAFKRHRACAWCRHTRHAAAYVDLRDGDDQLQFCSDKCLNQYKMHIFCRETQAYLQAHPHLLQQAEAEKGGGGGSVRLITPDLWLRDCAGVGGETPNGGADTADEKPSESELEDLSTAAARREDTITKQEDPKGEQAVKENSPERNPFSSSGTITSSALASYLVKRDEPVIKHEVDRRKRHHEGREGVRKRPARLSSFRSRQAASLLLDAPPAHLSSAAFPFAPPAANVKSSPLSNPPLAHSARQFHGPPGGGVLPGRLPPPPPLLNNDPFRHSPHLFSPHQHQQRLEAMLRLQQGLPPAVPGLYPPDPLMPGFRGAPAIPQANTMMLPYPVFVPLPVPIPVPIPLTAFLPKDSSVAPSGKGDSREDAKSDAEAPKTSQAECGQNPATTDGGSSRDSDEPSDLSTTGRERHKYLKRPKM